MTVTPTVYGCTSADFTTRNGRPVPAAAYTAWTDEVGGAPVTGLLALDGSPLVPQVSDADGGLRFKDPRGGDDPIWVDTGWGRRVAVRPLRIIGLSAYEVAAAAGYTDTEAEWVASLKGDTGDTGPRGPQGVPGEVTLADLALKADKASIGNLLPANVARPTTDGIGGPGNASVAQSGETVTITPTVSGFFSASTLPLDTVAVEPMHRYTAVIEDFTVAAGTSSAGFSIVWRDAGGATVSPAVDSNNIAAGTTGRAAVTAIAPTGAATMRLSIGGNGSGAVTIGRIGFWRGTGGQWAMPGTPILGLEDGLSKVGNLLTANQAAPKAGAWTLHNATEVEGTGTLTVTASETLAFGAYTTVPVTGNETYTLSVGLAATGRLALAYILWLDSGGSQISGVSGNLIAAGSSGTSKVTAVAPSNAVTARVYAANTDPGAAAAVVISKPGFWRGASGEWQMPGVPIPHAGILPTAQTPVPQAKLWAGSSWAPQPVIIGSGSPLNIVVPDFKGQRFCDTAQTLGAREWVATSTLASGWVVSDGDTGWRALSVANGWSGYVYVRRFGDQVEVKSPYNGLNAAAKLSNSYISALPAGFRPSNTGNYGVLGTACNHGNGDALAALTRDASLGLQIPAATVAWTNASASGVWSTTDPWPTSLP